jgi:hypothetical protein
MRPGRETSRTTPLEQRPSRSHKSTAHTRVRRGHEPNVFLVAPSGRRELGVTAQTEISSAKLKRSGTLRARKIQLSYFF